MQMQVIKAIVQGRYGTLEAWKEENPVPLPMELIYVTDLNRFKVGDGERAFRDLPFVGQDGKSLEYKIEGDLLYVRREGETTWNPLIVKGPPGRTVIPEIGDNGNWFLEGTDTGLPSRGVKGDKGEATVLTISDDGYAVLDGVKTRTLMKAHPTELTMYIDGKKYYWSMGVINDKPVFSWREAETA